jgi:hypothetical protein
VNSDQPDSNIQFVEQRQQIRPAYEHERIAVKMAESSATPSAKIVEPV